MKKILGLAMLCLSAPVLANDTSAVIGAGGLEFVANQDIVMDSEDLYISTEEVRVVYTFRNQSDKDQNILVAFPMPDIVPDFYAPVAYPTGPADNLFEFETRFNGEPVSAELHEYAFAMGVDRSAIIRDAGLPLVPFTEGVGELADALPPPKIAELVHLGLLLEEEYDVGNGWEKHYFPTWTYRATYTWEGNFPAGETVTVEHRYKPSVGGTVGVSFLSEPYEGYDPAKAYLEKYCTDDALKATLHKLLLSKDDLWSAPYYESWLSYILTTGRNWGGGAIGKFRLVVDKGDPSSLVSFCGEGVKKIGPTTFEMVKEDFWPSEELNILILRKRPE
jgi:hypothetical protein